MLIPRRVRSRAALAVAAIPVAVALPLAASAAHADTTSARFTPYEVSHDWYGPTPDTVANPWAVPQTSTVLTCGGIHQHDVYTITSQKMADDYAARLAIGSLTGPQDDAEFSPHDYTVTALPDCVVKPPQPPALVVPTVSHLLVCGDGFYYTTTSTVTTEYVYDATSNTWILGTPGEPVVNTTKVQATAAQCPPKTPVTPTHPAHPIVHHPSPPAPVVHAAAVKAPATPTPTTVPTSDAAKKLAYTGANTGPEIALAGSFLLGGLGLAIAARLRRRRS